MKPLVVGLCLALALSGCVTRNVTVAGTCLDERGNPRKGVEVVGKEIRGTWLALFVAALPEIRPVASTTTDEAGGFLLQFRSRWSMLLEIKDPTVKNPYGGRARISIPKEGERFSLSILSEDGYLSTTWGK